MTENAALIQAIEAAMLPVRIELNAVLELESYRPDYRQFPARITTRYCDGSIHSEVLKTANTEESIHFELSTLELLREVGLRVPKVLSPVFTLTQTEKNFWAVSIEELTGSPAHWLGLDSLRLADQTCKLVITGVRRLHDLTNKIVQLDTKRLLPRRELVDEYRQIKESSSPWLRDPIVSRALDLLADRLHKISVPLVFSSGDYNPLNFIIREGEIVGWLDFEHACLEDPYIGFVKFLLWSDDEWGWAAGARSGLVERFLFQENVRPYDFYCRILLRAVYHIHLRPDDDHPSHMLEIVEEFSRKIELLNNDTYLTFSST